MSDETPTQPQTDIIANLESKIKDLEARLTTVMSEKLAGLQESVKNMSVKTPEPAPEAVPVTSEVHKYPEEKRIDDPISYTTQYIKDTIDIVTEKFSLYRDHEMPPVSAWESMVYGMHVGGMTPEQIVEALPMKSTIDG